MVQAKDYITFTIYYELLQWYNSLIILDVVKFVGRQVALPTLFGERPCLMRISSASRPTG